MSEGREGRGRLCRGARPSATAAATLAIIALANLAACSGHSDTSTSHEHDAGTQSVDGSTIITCATDSRAEVYEPGIEKLGTGKKWFFSLVRATPSPPGRGLNQWVVALRPANGGTLPTDASAIAIEGNMPDHGHGWSTTPTITKQPDGSFAIDKLNLFMPGLWQITVSVTVDNVRDSTLFSFCVQG